MECVEVGVSEHSQPKDFKFQKCLLVKDFNPLAPSDPYMGRTAQLTSRGFILNTYSTNIHTEYFKRAA
jgi:hypothetical protein